MRRRNLLTAIPMLVLGMLPANGAGFAHPILPEVPPRRLATPLRVKILLNLSPARAEQSTLNPDDTFVLISMVRRITQDSRVGSFSLLAFNLREQRVVYESGHAMALDFPALARALKSRSTGTIEYRLLKDRSSETRFATELLTHQLGSQAEERPDAIVIVGPKVTLDRKIPLESLRAGGAAACPIFYFNYNPNPLDDPWRDTIGSSLKAYPGALAYNIVRPSDFRVAMSKFAKMTN